MKLTAIFILISAFFIFSGCKTITEQQRAEINGYLDYTPDQIPRMDDKSLVIIIRDWKKQCPNTMSNMIHLADEELLKRYPSFYQDYKNGKIAVGMPEHLALMAWPHHLDEPDNVWATASGTRRQFCYRYQNAGIPVTYKWFVTQNGTVTMFEESPY